MSKERQQLIKDKRERNEDREEMARRLHQSRVGGRKRDASQLSKRVADDHSRTVAAQFQCIDAGYRLVSQPQTFQPKLEKFDTLPNFSRLRSQTELEPVLFSLIPLDLWSQLFLGVNQQVQVRVEKEKLRAQVKRNERHSCSSAKYAHGNYRTLSESRFWRLMATIVYACQKRVESVDDLYASQEDINVQKLLPFTDFKKYRPCLIPERLEQFCETLTAIWTKGMISSGVFCVDESLWKFVPKGTGGENREIVRTIPRKPAGTGLLSYELCGFTTYSKMPYTYGIMPITLSQAPSARDAALHLISRFNAEKPVGTPAPPVCILDSAFSSADTLKEITKLGWTYCVSLNSQWYQQLAAVLKSDLCLYQYRNIIGPDDTIYTGYFTQFNPTDRQTNTGDGTGQSVLFLNATNAFTCTSSTTTLSARTTSPSSSSGRTGPPPGAPPSASSANPSPSSSAFQRSRLPTEPVSADERLAILRVLMRPRPIPVRISIKIPREGYSAAKRLRVHPTQPFSGAETTDPVVKLGQREFTRAQIVSMTVPELRNLLSFFGFSTVGMLKFDLVNLILKVRDEENLKQVSMTMSPKETRGPNQNLDEILPMISLYRSNFASIDKADVYLSLYDTQIRFKHWKNRLLDRILALAFNNVRAYIAEAFYAKENRHHRYKVTQTFLSELFELFVGFANEAQAGTHRRLGYVVESFACSSSNQ